MQFVIGGAFNGKRAWVKGNYPGCKWISCYQGDSLQGDVEFVSTQAIVIEGLEVWIREVSEKMKMDEARRNISEVLTSWEAWETADTYRKLILIGTDITKGIVPLDKKDRNWRDLTGWVYQDLTSRCNQVDVIWYGIHQTIKSCR